MNSHLIYLALGSNLGDRRDNLQAALNFLRAGGHLQVQSLSNLYETEPVGYADQPRFLNMALQALTDLEPLALLDYLKSIETRLGRQPTFRNGPRPLDLDIIFYDELVLDQERLQIPHPRLQDRGFVLAPLVELCPAYVHPGLGITVANMLAEIDLAEADVKLWQEEAPLEIPPPRFMFITGQLAQGWLQDFLADLTERLDFEYRVKALNIDVAAFMTCRFIAEKLQLSQQDYQELDCLIVPGFAGGDTGLIEEATGIRTLRGPTELAEIEPFLAELLQAQRGPEHPVRLTYHYSEEQLRLMQSRLTDANIRIYTNGERVFAFNNTVFGSAEPNERELRQLFRLLKIDNASHAYYLGRELYKAALCIRLGRRYRQDREIDEG